MSDIPWFHPFTYTISLPKRVSDMTSNFEDVAPLVHENLHYLQSVTTFTGAYRFLCFWQAYAAIASCVTEDLATKESTTLKAWAREAYEKANQARKNLEPRYLSVDIEQPIPLGAQVLQLPDGDTIRAYTKRLTTGDTRAFFFSNEAVSESMAMAYEVWLGADIQVLEPYAKAEHPNHFQYAIGFETARHFSSDATPEFLAQMVFIACDFALNHVTAGLVFFEGVRLLCASFSEPLPQSDIMKAYDVLNAALMFEEVREETEKIKTQLNGISNSAEQTEDPFDRGVSAMTSLMEKSLRLRENQPSFFAEKLLFEFHDAEFLNDFHLPLYRHGKDIIDTGHNAERFDAVLFFEALHHRLMKLVDDTQSSACPFHDNRLCGFERNQDCTEAPWKRRFADETNDKAEVCVYRFVENGLEKSR